jgi:DNA-binding transcriptional MerR regulator
MAAAADERLTIDELAARASLPSSTLRMYQHRGLLPPPARDGRVGYYGPGHVARLALIADLQARGFSLAGIKELIDAWEQGRGLDDVLGLEAQATSLAAGREPVRLRMTDMVKRMAGQKLTPALLRRGFELGLLELDGRAVVTDARFLAFGTELAAIGIPLGEIMDQWEALRASTATIAERFVGVFERHVWRSFVAAGMPADQVGELTATLRRLGPLAEEVTVTALRLALTEAASAFVAEQARHLDDPGALEQLRRGAAGG